jgi:hypothetical protein
MFMVSLAYAGEAVNIYTSDRWENVMEYFQGFFAITILLIGIPATIYNVILELRKRKKTKGQMTINEAGFVQSIYNTTAVRAFSFVFILLLFVEQMGPRILPDQPMEFFFDAVIALTLMFFSIAFWVEMSKAGSDEADE